jgi:lipopolysaccharide biosynthesis glycosyltransferase
MSSRKRIIYVAIDSDLHLKMMRISAATVIANTAHKIDFEFITKYQGAEAGLYRNRDIKTNLFSDDYSQTLFIDCDILVVNNIDEIWDYRGICICRNRNPQISGCWHVGETEKSETLTEYGDLPHYNSGVILFDNSQESKAFFEDWNREWKCYQSHDQLALSRSLANNNIRVTELPEKFNCYHKESNDGTVFKHFSGNGKAAFFEEAE